LIVRSHRINPRRDLVTCFATDWETLHRR
jgi:hypothetical protein